jgi:putative transposase
VIFHVLNRANARARIFEKDLDYEAFRRVIDETAKLIPVEIFAYAIMPNHWHMVLRPTRDGDLGNLVQRLTTTHVRRWHLHRKSVGSGHLYQGTYKSLSCAYQRNGAVLLETKAGKQVRQDNSH